MFIVWQWLTYLACAAGLVSTLACLMQPKLPGWLCVGLIINAGYLFGMAVEISR